MGASEVRADWWCADLKSAIEFEAEEAAAQNYRFDGYSKYSIIIL
jgi:hypothetical protein